MCYNHIYVLHGSRTENNAGHERNLRQVYGSAISETRNGNLLAARFSAEIKMVQISIAKRLHRLGSCRFRADRGEILIFFS